MTENLFNILENDHKQVENYLNEAVNTKSASKFREIKNQLEMHMNGEEKYFYPRLSFIGKQEIDKSFSEHEEVKKIIKEISNTKNEEQLIPNLEKLKRAVDEHIQREEDFIFPKAEEKLSTLQKEEIAQQIEEEKMSRRFRSIPNEKLVPLPDNIDIPRTIPASKVRIPSAYTKGDVEYEDDQGNPVDKEKATHIRLTGIDKRSDIVIGPVEGNGMIRLTLYLDDDNLPENRDKSTNKRSKIFNEQYRPIKK